MNREALVSFLKKGAGRHYPIFLLHINIKNFSRYNQRYGSAKGNSLLRCVAKNLTRWMEAITVFDEPTPRRSYLFRDYADHFYLLNFTRQHDYLTHKITQAIEKVMQVCDIAIDTEEIYFTTASSPSMVQNCLGYLL